MENGRIAVFLSFKHGNPDEELADFLRRRLRLVGIDVVRLKEQPPISGQNLPDVITDRISVVVGLVTLWSKRASESYWVGREREIARTAGIVECLILYPNTELPSDWPRESGRPAKVYEPIEGVIKFESDPSAHRGFQVSEDRFAELVGRILQFARAEGSRRGQRGLQASRAKLLLELFREFEGKVNSIPTVLNFVSVDPNLFRLPRYESARADGSVYSVLEEEDRSLLVAQAPQPLGGFSAPGILERFLRDGAGVVDRSNLELARKGRLTEQGTGNDIRIFAMSILPGELRSFRSHLTRLGLL